MVLLLNNRARYYKKGQKQSLFDIYKIKNSCRIKSYDENGVGCVVDVTAALALSDLLGVREQKIILSDPLSYIIILFT